MTINKQYTKIILCGLCDSVVNRFRGLSCPFVARNRRRGEEGAAAVEFAIVVVLLLMLTFGAAEFGWMFYQIYEVNNAARGGAREAAVSGGDVGVFVRDNFNDAYDVLTEDAGNSGQMVRVTVSAPYTSLTGLTTWLFSEDGAPAELSASVTMAKET